MYMSKIGNLQYTIYWIENYHEDNIIYIYIYLMEFRIMNQNVDTISSSWHLDTVLDPNLL